MKSNLYYKEIETKIISNLRNAKKSVKIAVAWFTNPTLYELISELHRKEIQVEIILSDEKLNFINEKVDFQKLIDKGVEISVGKFPNLMHNKFCIIDNRILITGSYNWTLKAEKSNYENVIISTDEKLVDNFLEYFQYLKDNLDIIINISNIETNEYLDKNELEIEIKLLRESKSINIEIERNESKSIYDDNIENAINTAELLYLNCELEKAIDFTNKQLKKNPNIPEFYQILALSYWRLKDFEKQIFYSQKLLELENDSALSLSAYNLLGIGYSLKKGGEQQSLFYYKKCIEKNPQDHTYYRNRAISFIDLESIPSLPLNIRNNYKNKADEDLRKILEISKNTEIKDYPLLHSEALANSYLGNHKMALANINMAIDVFNNEKDIFKRDKNELKEMKGLQKDYKKNASK